MKWPTLPRVWTLLFLALVASVAAEDPTQVELPTISGETIRPGDPGEAAFAVLVFITSDCPIANAFQPELRRLEARARELGGQFTLVHVVPTLSNEEAARHGRDYGISARMVIDREHRLVKATGVEMTPEAVVVVPGGGIAYRGRINNLYVTYGKRRAEATQNDLRDAMEAVASGKPVATPKTEALGCYIPALP